VTKLHDLQSEFAVALCDPNREIPGGVTSHNTRRPVRRFKVYRNNMVVSLTDLLQAYFPVVTRLVGEEFFRAMARDFIVRDPPRSPILSRFGARFPHFIQQFPPAQDLPYLADVARLEWLQQRAYHAADRAPITARDLASVPAEQMPDVVFELHPAVGLTVSPFPVVSIWKTNMIDSDVRSISLDEGGEAALVVRPQLDVQVVPLPSGADTFLALVMMDYTVSEATTASRLVDREFDLQQSLALLIGSGAIADFEVRQTRRYRARGGGNHDR
jgi:hypothetical protein